MPPPRVKTKELIHHFFTQSDEDVDYFICNRCDSKNKQQRNTGYTNLKNHLRCCIGDNFEELFLNTLGTPVASIDTDNRDAARKPSPSSRQGRLQSFGGFDLISEGISEREKHVFQLIEWVVMRHIPLSVVDDETTKQILNIQIVDSKTLRRYLLSLADLVEKKIQQDLPDMFAVEIDGWKSYNDHYVALIASCANIGAPKEYLLALAPFSYNNNENIGAEQRTAFLEATLELYNKTLENVEVLKGANTPMHRKVSEDTSIPLLRGAARHRIHLAANDWRRECMSPVMFEALTFLKTNRQYWELRMVERAMKVNHPRGLERDSEIFY